MTETEKLTAKPVKKSKSGGGLVFVMVLLIVIIAMAFFAKSGMFQGEEDQDVQVQAAEMERVLRSVRKHILLPEGQEPAVLTVEDPEKLAREQAFFIGASQGDKLIIYPNKAILYNPSEDVLVNVGPVYFNPDESAISE